MTDHLSLATKGTYREIHSGEPAHLLLPALLLVSVGLVLSLRVGVRDNGGILFIEKLSGSDELGVDVAGGLETEVSDFYESAWQDVQQKATDELQMWQGGGLVAFCGEGDSIVIAGNQAVIGDGDPVGVSAEVVKDLLGTVKGSPRIDAPFDVVELVDEGLEESGIGHLFVRGTESQLRVFVGAFEGIQELVTEELCDDITWEEVFVKLRGNPTIAGKGQPSSGDDAVKMWMEK